MFHFQIVIFLIHLFSSLGCVKQISFLSISVSLALKHKTFVQVYKDKNNKYIYFVEMQPFITPLKNVMIFI